MVGVVFITKKALMRELEEPCEMVLGSPIGLLPYWVAYSFWMGDFLVLEEHDKLYSWYSIVLWGYS
jgi:hypothetical protein